ncbi:hypothetical protein [Variovorax sp. HW608]|uniref:hypothetical protein n=1 Tax=Variovorax sp. HW608 TaxID=1034889 RepID=UPI0012FDB203|nr:hypothetical protein [Variovorax sp. HW608]
MRTPDPSPPLIAFPLAADIEHEFGQPARLQALSELLPQASIDRLNKKLANASADLAPIERLVFESRAWERVIRKLRSQRRLK